MTTNESSLESLLNEAGGQAEDADDNWTQPAPEVEEPTTVETVENGQAAIDEARNEETRREEEASVPVRPRSAPTAKADLTDVDTASAIIRILDALRALDTTERKIATELVSQGRELTTEADTVLSVMSAPGSLIKTIRSLLEARDLEPVERAFYLMKLERASARNMATLVSAFRNDLTANNDHIELARTLVSEIDELEEDDINNVRATESLFSAYEGSADSK